MTELILGIESSCDETAAALVSDSGVVLSNVIASQIKDHAPYGGVVPEIAARAHLRAIKTVVKEALAERPLSSISAIAVTNGPGLVGALLIGVQFAKTLAHTTNIPLVGVNHLTGHLLSPFLTTPDDSPFELSDAFPYLGLLVSGGHTALYRVNDFDDVVQLGQTRDDAAGEAYDKVAKLLGLGYPGGPVIDKLAQLGNPKAIPLPKPMPQKSNPNFSFSGLKTAVARHVRNLGEPPTGEGLHDLCASFQHVVSEVLVGKSISAAQSEGLKTLVIAGGVAANSGLRRKAQAACEKHKITLRVPPMSVCTDNAAMIAYAGALHFRRNGGDESVSVYSRDPARQRGKFRRDGSLVQRK